MRAVRIAMLLLCASILAWSGFFRVALAQIPFGGFKIITIPCTANPPYFLEYYIPAGPGMPPSLMEPPIVPYSYNAFLVPGVPMLGIAGPVAIPCLVYAGVTVITIGSGNPVLEEGTGL